MASQKWVIGEPISVFHFIGKGVVPHITIRCFGRGLQQVFQVVCKILLSPLLPFSLTHHLTPLGSWICKGCNLAQSGFNPWWRPEHNVVLSVQSSCSLPGHGSSIAQPLLLCHPGTPASSAAAWILPFTGPVDLPEPIQGRTILPWHFSGGRRGTRSAEQWDYAYEDSSGLNRGMVGKEGPGWSEGKHKGTTPSEEWIHKTEKKYFLGVVSECFWH